MTSRSNHWREILREVDEEGEDLTDWEIEFVSGLVDELAEDPDMVISRKQDETLRKIHRERVE